MAAGATEMNWHRELKLSYIRITDRIKCFWLLPDREPILADEMTHDIYVIDDILSKHNISQDEMSAYQNLMDAPVKPCFNSPIKHDHYDSGYGDYGDDFDDMEEESMDSGDDELDYVYEILSRSGLSDEEIRVVTKDSGPIEYAIDKLNWIRVNNNSSEVRRLLDFRTMMRLYNHMKDIYERSTKIEIHISDHSSGEGYILPLSALSGSPESLSDYLKSPEYNKR